MNSDFSRKTGEYRSTVTLQSTQWTALNKKDHQRSVIYNWRDWNLTWSFWFCQHCWLNTDSVLMVLIPVLCDSKEITQTLTSLVHLISCDKKKTHLPRQNRCALTDLGRSSGNSDYLRNFVTVCFFTLRIRLLLFSMLHDCNLRNTNLANSSSHARRVICGLNGVGERF